MIDKTYQDLIVKYNQSPHNFGQAPNATHQAEGYNQICGDQLKVTTEFSNQEFKSIYFEGDCCAVAKAAASLMIKELEGANTFEFQQAYAELEEKDFFKELHIMPSRLKCAKLPWATLKAALDGKESTTTE